jgi:hypothetical protein
LNLSNTHLANNNNDRVEFMQSSSSGVEILEAEEEDRRCGQSDGHAQSLGKELVHRRSRPFKSPVQVPSSLFRHVSACSQIRCEFGLFFSSFELETPLLLLLLLLLLLPIWPWQVEMECANRIMLKPIATTAQYYILQMCLYPQNVELAIARAWERRGLWIWRV